MVLNNHFYRTAPVIASNQVSINFVPGIISNNDTISGNYIGGTAPNCGGSAWNNTVTSTGSVGIIVNAGTEAGTQVQNNTIQNFLFSQTTIHLIQQFPQKRS